MGQDAVQIHPWRSGINNAHPSPLGVGSPNSRPEPYVAMHREEERPSVRHPSRLSERVAQAARDPWSRLEEEHHREDHPDVDGDDSSCRSVHHLAQSPAAELNRVYFVFGRARAPCGTQSRPTRLRKGKGVWRHMNELSVAWGRFKRHVQDQQDSECKDPDNRAVGKPRQLVRLSQRNSRQRLPR